MTDQIPNARPTILVACRKNAGRSQAAASIMRHLAGDKVLVLSGGSEPAEKVHEEVRQVLAERGLGVEEVPKAFDEAMVKSADVVVTMGCGEECPYFPGKRYLDWEVEDPHNQSVDKVRAIVDDIEQRVRSLLSELGIS